jgi:hypothetical protein
MTQWGGGETKLTVFSKSEGHVDNDLSASCFLCLTNEQQTPCTTEQVTVPSVDVDMAILRTVPMPTAAQISLPHFTYKFNCCTKVLHSPTDALFINLRKL